MPEPDVEDLLRREAPQVLVALVRHYGHFELAEEAVQDALLESATTWTRSERPTNPRGWLIRVSQRGLIDALRSEYSRATSEERYASWKSSKPSLLPRTSPATAASTCSFCAATRSVALELLHDARRETRERHGPPVPLGEQDRTQWDAGLSSEGTALIDTPMARGPLGPYRSQATITAVHCAAASAAHPTGSKSSSSTTCSRGRPQPYGPGQPRRGRLARTRTGRGTRRTRRGRAVPLLAHSRRVAAVRGHLLEQQGYRAGAIDAYLQAARATKFQSERRHLRAQAERPS